MVKKQRSNYIRGHKNLIHIITLVNSNGIIQLAKHPKYDQFYLLWGNSQDTLSTVLLLTHKGYLITSQTKAMKIFYNATQALLNGNISFK
jgi:hypothetical protein